MTERVDFPCVILAGGEASRFGSPKGLAVLDGRKIIEHVIENMREQTAAEIIINSKTEGVYSDYSVTIADPEEFTGYGPLAGLLSAMNWAAGEGYSRVATVPVDMPLLPAILLNQLSETAAPSFATTQDDEHYVVGVWPIRLRQKLEEYLLAGHRSMKGWIKECSAQPVTFNDDEYPYHFSNINTEEDLEKLKKALILKGVSCQ